MKRFWLIGLMALMGFSGFACSDDDDEVFGECKYSGTWSGTFTYTLTDIIDTKKTLAVELTLSCQSNLGGMNSVNITHAKVDNSFFGCENGCDISTMAATLPDPGKDATGSVSVLFPNNATIKFGAVFNGKYTISSDGKHMSGGDCSRSDDSWSVMGTPKGSDGSLNYFENVKPGDTSKSLHYNCWNLDMK